ncbi:23S rRNA (uracil(1939)-C(5))-methyltransferase RlmD [Mycoplasma phocimorsus]|uniref:23S rRNA (uracil(1939)-C(5))-methyltransferase RlmD n=1 Tax=Mycoplasma phocimorsus TaxID=3045839 RepID=UPI0024BF513A|nr:23S rRNA (uracil(1939)-C(5))-methyltransferase RlmD [Mycoplasma phocimorsus]MDJ1646976.1 23S rRNA (uracil(1939)-C(5))-methyltransferase RlmD [Mycoplasma phocimorsus]
MKINNLTITEQTYEGYGGARQNNKLILVENALVGENVNVFIYKKTKNIYYANVIKFNIKSPDRIIENSVLLQSGAALISNISYEKQLEFKNNYVSYLFNRNLNINPNPIIKSAKIWNYRNKITLFTKIINNKINYYLKKKNSNELILVNEFKLAYEQISNILYKIQNNKWNFNENSIISIMVRSNERQDQFQILFEIENYNKLLIKQLSEINLLDSRIKNISYKLNEKIVNILNYGFSINIENKEFVMDVNSFFQINLLQATLIYNQIKDFIKNTNSYNIIDVFCGVGSIGIFASNNNLVGIEIVKQAIENAKINAQKNNIKNYKFIAANESNLNINFNMFDFVILDPPRAGVSAKNIQKINESNVNYIAYLSCDVRTQVRDLKLLNTYKILSITPYDMFPQTPHIESLCFLKKIK